MMHSDGPIKVVDNFAPDGTRESSVQLQPSPTPFFPSQLAMFQSGEIFVSGLRYRPGYKASTAIYSKTGSLLKQLTLDEDEKIEQEIAADSAAQNLSKKAVDRSGAVAGDDGLVYLMRPTNNAVVYAISPSGEVVRKLLITGPVGAGSPEPALRVVENRLLIQFRRDCDGNIRACVGSIYWVLDATTGRRLAAYETTKEVAGPIACYFPDGDRFSTFSASPDRHGLDIVEAQAKDGSP